MNVSESDDWMQCGQEYILIIKLNWIYIIYAIGKVNEVFVVGENEYFTVFITKWIFSEANLFIHLMTLSDETFDSKTIHKNQTNAHNIHLLDAFFFIVLMLRFILFSFRGKTAINHF